MRNILFLLITVILTGCGYRIPANFPATAPCRITVLKNGVPQNGVEVSLTYPGTAGAVAVSANTDSSGAAQLQTRWAKFVKKGAPVGNAKVTLIKHVGLPAEYAPKENEPEMKPEEFRKLAQKIEAEIDRQREVPKALSYHKTTPLEINVQRQKNELTVDLADFGKQASKPVTHH